ncbi:MAG: sensor histidine kinase [Thainema sp.]
MQERLFDPFFTTKSVGKGMGLGLSISHQIIMGKHNGQLTCYSTVGEGAEFVIELPCYVPITERLSFRQKQGLKPTVTKN